MSNDKENKFDLAEFNKAYEMAAKDRQMKNALVEQQVLDELNKPDSPKSPFNRSITEIFIGIKDTLLEILDDVLQFKINSNTLVKNHRLFYLGILLIIYVVLFNIYTSFEIK